MSTRNNTVELYKRGTDIAVSWLCFKDGQWAYRVYPREEYMTTLVDTTLYPTTPEMARVLYKHWSPMEKFV